MKADRVAMKLARKAIDLRPAQRLGWLLRAHPNLEIVEAAISLVLAFQDDDQGLGFEVATSEPAASHQLALPDYIDRFRVLGLLGAGSFSFVYRACDESTGQEVALKVLHATEISPVMEQRFNREIAVLSALHHESIASLIEAGATENELGVVRWIALELVDGVSFREAAKGLEPREIARLIARVARAVHYAHTQDQQIIHRDLKPSNVLVHANGLPKVVDFGVASLKNSAEHQRLTATGQVLGTIGYMSPEQVAGHAPDTAADQFALGVMLFEALTGSLPHSDGREGLQGLFSIASWDGRINPQQRRELDPQLAAVLTRSLDPDPALRFPTALAFADDLERWIVGKPVLTMPPSRWRKARRFINRNRGPVAAAVGVFLLLGIALGTTLLALGSARFQSQRASAMGDQSLVALLLRQATELWPQSPATTPNFDLWISSSEVVLGRQQQSVQGIEDGPQRAGFQSDLEELLEVSNIVRRRRELAVSLHQRSVEARDAPWQEAIERVTRDPRFDDLQLLPQTGLIPLGPDPSSGLEEFAVTDWGSLPARDPATGELILMDDFTPVLVLIPGGLTRFGCEPIPEAERVYPDGRSLYLTVADVGLRDVALDPFLIGKFEVTQAQWLAITGETPAEWRMGEDNYGILMTGRHPVETVSFFECLAAAERIDCTLPTEAQWQHAAQPTGRGMHWWPEDKVWDTAPENLELGGQQASYASPWPADKHSFHAPVGTFAPNPFGLYDVLGNVCEHCLDPFKVFVLQDTSMAIRSGDGCVMEDGGGDYSLRGSNGRMTLEQSSLARRMGPTGGTRSGDHGVRFSRRLVTIGETSPPSPGGR